MTGSMEDALELQAGPRSARGCRAKLLFLRRASEPVRGLGRCGPSSRLRTGV